MKVYLVHYFYSTIFINLEQTFLYANSFAYTLKHWNLTNVPYFLCIFHQNSLAWTNICFLFYRNLGSIYWNFLIADFCKVDISLVNHFPHTKHGNDLFSATARLKVEVSELHAGENGHLEISCRATIPDFLTNHEQFADITEHRVSGESVYLLFITSIILLFM